MYNIKLAGLDTGRKYYVKVRAKVNGYETSEWSIPFQFLTPKDKMPPGRVENVSFISEGDSFIASWKAPEFNEDGSPCGDLSHYLVTLKDLDRNVTRNERVTETTLSIDYNRNISLFGQAAGRIEMTIVAVDFSGNQGKAVTIIAQNPPPLKVQNVVATSGMESVGLRWTEGIETDLMHYEIHVGSTSDFIASALTLMANVAPGTNTFTHDSSSLSILYFKVLAVDKFNQKSIPSDVASAQPRLTTDFDKEPPATVSEFTVIQTLSPDNASATATVSFGSVADLDLDKYEIQYRKTGETATPWSFATIPSDQNSAEIRPLPLSTDYDFRIRAVDFNANKGAWSSTVVAAGVKKTTLPPAPTNVIARGGMTNLMVTWTESSDPTMANWAGVYEVHVAKTPTFSNPSVIKTSSTLTSLINLDENTVYYVRVRSIDPFDNIGPWSNVESENTGEVESGGNKSTFEATDPTGTGHIDGDIWYKVDAEENIIGMWEFFGNNWIRREIKNLADDSVTSGTISADAVLAGHIKAGEIEGTHLKANTALINDLSIRSSLTIDSASGHIKSSNYSANGSAGFYMDQQQLIINQGKIKAAAIELQDSQNLLPSIYAGLNHSPKIYDEIAISDDGAVTNYWPNAGRAFNGALAHQGVNTIVMLAPTVTSHYIYLEGGQKYIVSGYLSSAETGSANASLGLFHSAPTTEESGIVWSQIATATSQTEHVRVQFVFAPTSDVICAIMLKNNGPGTAAPVWSCFQVERVVAASEQASPWTPPGSTSIEGESIVTGSISSRDTISTANGDIALWSIDTWGKARFADATIDGKLIVGGRVGADNINTYIQSDNYVSGISGWAIRGDGDVEFNNGVFRGSLSLGRVGNSEIDLWMNMAVSPVKVYATATDPVTINVANIQGATHSYARVESVDGVYLPSNQIKPGGEGRFFIGPTTDRSINVQVHDGPEAGSVYLSDAPDNVSLTALNIGEQTDPLVEPVNRENQGVKFTTKRVDSKSYPYFESVSVNQDRTTISSEMDSSIKLRSALYPEADESKDMYPSSMNMIESSIDYRAPSKKNLLNTQYANGWWYPAMLRSDAISAVVTSPTREEEYMASPGSDGGRQASINIAPMNQATHVQITPWTQLATKTTGRHIFSFFVDTSKSSTDLLITAKAGSKRLTPRVPNTVAIPPAQNIDNIIMPRDRFDLNSTSQMLNQADDSGEYLNNGTVVNGSVTRYQDGTYFGAAARMAMTTRVIGQFAYGGTISFWINPSPSNGAEANMYHRGSTSSTAKEMWIMFNGNTNALTGGIALSNGARFWSTSSNVITPNQWNHIVITIGSSVTNREFKVYINGSITVDTTFTGITGSFDTGQTLWLGADRNYTTAQRYTGHISELKHYDRALSLSEIHTLRATPRVHRTLDQASTEEYALVPAGEKNYRVSFYADGSVSGLYSLAFASENMGEFKIGAFQLEEALYRTDMTLDSEIRDSNLPTPWATSATDIGARAKISVKTKPMTNWLDYVDSTKALLPGEAGTAKLEPPAEILFDLSSSYRDDFIVSTGFGSEFFQSDSQYSLSAKGMAYPGAPAPFMPAALSIQYDFTTGTRPTIGGGSEAQKKLALNNSDFGNLNFSNSVPITEAFSYPNRSTLPSPWNEIGGRPFPISGSTVFMHRDNRGEDGTAYAMHGQEFPTHDHDVQVEISSTNGSAIGSYHPSAGPMVSIDPVRGDRIYLRVQNFTGTSALTWNLYVYKENVLTYADSGVISRARTGTANVRLVRDGNTIKCFYNGASIRQVTLSASVLPEGGRFTGFSGIIGRIDNFVASDSSAPTTNRGTIMPYSYNINNGRGIRVFTKYEFYQGSGYYPGDIYVLVPGYYSVSASVVADGILGSSTDDLYHIEIEDGRGEIQYLSSPASRANGTAGRFNHIQGSGTLYLNGRVIFRLVTSDSGLEPLTKVDLNIVRLA